MEFKNFHPASSWQQIFLPVIYVELENAEIRLQRMYLSVPTFHIRLMHWIARHVHMEWNKISSQRLPMWKYVYLIALPASFSKGVRLQKDNVSTDLSPFLYKRG